MISQRFRIFFYIANHLICYAALIYVLALSSVVVFKPRPNLIFDADTVSQIRQIYFWCETAFSTAKYEPGEIK